MSSDDYMDEKFGKAFDFIGPRVDNWIKELFGGFEALNLSGSQKDLIQGLTIETMLYNTLMPNEEIISALAGIIQNIASRNSYGKTIDWGKREDNFKKYSGQRK